MTSSKTFECFTCKNNGFPAVMVYLAGKDDRGRAIRLEEDGVTPHIHQTKVPSQQGQQQQTTTAQVQDEPLLRSIDSKLTRILEILDKDGVTKEGTNI